MQPHGFRLEEKVSADFDLIGFRVEGAPSIDQLRAARESVLRLAAPATDQELLSGLVRLKSLTSSRNMRDEELDLQIEAMVSKLKEYPRDAALAALERIADEVEWFPAWKQIRAWCQFYSRRRQFALGAIEAAILRKTMKAVSA